MYHFRISSNLETFDTHNRNSFSKIFINIQVILCGMFTLGVTDLHNRKTNLILTVNAFKVAVLVSEG